MTDEQKDVEVRRSRMYIIIAFGILILIGGVVAPYVSAQETQDHKTTEGTVLSSEVESEQVLEDGEQRWKYYPIVEYEYEVDGQRYTNTRIYIDRSTCTPGGDVCGIREYDSKRPAGRLADRYPEGETVTVHYDPAEPETAYLVEVPGFPTVRNVLWGLLGVVLAGIGVAGLRGVPIERAIPFWNP